METHIAPKKVAFFLMPSTARPRTARAEAAPDFGIVGMAPASAQQQQQQQQQEEERRRRPATTATAARRSNARASSSSSRRQPTDRGAAAANAGGGHRSSSSSSRSRSRPATSGRASGTRTSSGPGSSALTAKQLAAEGALKAAAAAAAAAAASTAAATTTADAAEPESELVNWKIKNWQNHQKAIRRKQALASQGIELNHNQRPNNDIVRVEAAERRAMAALENGFTERTLDELRGIVQRRLFSFVKGGHFELGKTWKRIRQVRSWVLLALYSRCSLLAARDLPVFFFPSRPSTYLLTYLLTYSRLYSLLHL
jgi:hypothetical protein